MSRRCYACDKGPTHGNAVSRHTSHHVKSVGRVFRPNLQSVKVMTGRGPRRVFVCTSCLKSNKVVRIK